MGALWRPRSASAVVVAKEKSFRKWDVTPALVSNLSVREEGGHTSGEIENLSALFDDCQTAL
jgi:hypothetical protein